MANWRFVLATRWHENIGEILNATDRQVMLPINGVKTLGFKVRLDNPLSDYMMLNEANYIKAYRGSTIMFHGPIFSVEENGDAVGATLTVNAVGPEWFLSKSFIPEGPGGYRAVTIDRGLALDWFAGSLTGGGWIDFGSDAERTVGDVIDWTHQTNATDSETLIAVSESGFAFDWLIDVLDPSAISTGSTPNPVGKLHIYSSLGSAKTNAVFEWGTGTRANLSGYKKVITRETQANHIYIPGGTSIANAGNDSTLNKNWGKMVEYVADVENLSFADAGDLCQTHFDVRKLPRQTIEITPHVDSAVTGRLPNYGTDYSIGDTVRVRSVYGKSIRFDGMVRVYAATFNIDNNGVESTSLTVST